jgi:hypothetical protein
LKAAERLKPFRGFESHPRRVPEQSYALTPQLTNRTFPIVAVIDGIGMVLLAVGLVLAKPYLFIPGIVIIVGASALLSVTIMMRARVSTTVRLADQGLTITSGGRTASAAWTDISDVSAAGQTIYLNRHSQQDTLKIDSPRGADDPAFRDLSNELARRLDQSRGYHDL